MILGGCDTKSKPSPQKPTEPPKPPKPPKPPIKAKPETHMTQGKTYYQQGKHNNAIAAYTKAIDLYTDGANKATAYFRRGVLYYWNSNIPNAIADYTKAIDLYTDNDKTQMYHQRGIAYFMEKDYVNALADYTKAIDLYTDDTDKAKANEDKTTANVLSNAKAQKFYRRGLTHSYNANTYANAIADFTQALKHYTDNNDKAWMYYQRVLGYFKQRKKKLCKYYYGMHRSY